VSLRFCTLQREVETIGVGLHCGQTVRARLKPSARLGISFVRADLPGAPGVEADIAHVSATTHATTLECGQARVQTVEHLLAALWASGLTHVEVELDAPEVPILDGSAAPWLELLERAGREEFSGSLGARPVARLQKPVWLEGAGGAQMLGLPLDAGEEAAFRLTVAVDFGVEGARAQTFDGFPSETFFWEEISSARTFTLESWLEPLRAQGLIRGGSLDNALLIQSDGTISPPLRFPNELARHKALDVVGDLALALCPTGARFAGHIVALRAGHGTHRDWLAQALASGALAVESFSPL